MREVHVVYVLHLHLVKCVEDVVDANADVNELVVAALLQHRSQSHGSSADS